MLKFFRTIRHRLLDSGSLRKYLVYAIGEIFLVMVGILLALQVNNWNKDRLDRQRENQFLNQIHKEFEINKVQLQQITAYNQETADYCNKLIDLMPIDLTMVNLDSLGLYIGKSGLWWTFEPSEGSIDALINTSSFEVISDEELKILLVKWKGIVGDYMNTEKIMMEHLNQIYNPFRDKNFPRNQNHERGYNLKDPRMDLSFLTTFEFENQIKRRKTMLDNTLVEGNRQTVQQTIEDILNRTKQ